MIKCVNIVTVCPRKLIPAMQAHGNLITIAIKVELFVLTKRMPRRIRASDLHYSKEFWIYFY